VALRVEESKTKITDTAQTLQATPWIPSGWISASDVIKAAPGLFGGIIVYNAAEQSVEYLIIWDSADGTTGAGYVEIGRVYCAAGADDKDFLFALEPGIEAKLGIYVELQDQSNLSYNVYYK